VAEIADDPAERGVDSEQHLEFESFRWNAKFVEDPQRLEHETFIMRRDPDECASREHLPEAVRVVAVHDVGLLPRDRPRLDVDPLAEAEVRADRRSASMSFGVRRR